MTNDKKWSDSQLLEWAKAIIAEAQNEKQWVKITVHMQDGKILRVETSRNYKPG